MRILFLEDEPTIREVLTEYMKMKGYQVSPVDNGDDALILLKSKSFDMAVLDIMVPGAKGLDVLSYIKENSPDTAAIMLTALGDEKTQIEAFNLYADDYIIKPVSPLILLKRMETILRRVKREDVSMDRNQSMEKDRSTHKGLVLQEDSYQAFYDGRPLSLTLTEYLLLQTLKNEPHRAFTREQLILRIFNEDYVGNDRIIDAHVKNLRKKLPGDFIKTVIGVGYQFQQEK